MVTYKSKMLIASLPVASSCFAQDGLTIHARNKQKAPAAEADKIYLSACSVIQREFGSTRPVRPQLTLVLGADKDEAYRDGREIRLIKWSPYLFAQGVVVFAFEDLLLPPDERMTVARRPMTGPARR